MTQFVSKRQLAQHLKLSDSTLKRYRLSGIWIEGLHWIRLNSRCTRYNLDLIDDWLQNRNNPGAHQRAIEIQRASLLSSGSKTRKSNGLQRLTPAPPNG
jgi:hypothetical protein